MFTSLTGCVALGQLLRLCASVSPSVQWRFVTGGQNHTGGSHWLLHGRVHFPLGTREARIPSPPHRQEGSDEGCWRVGVEVTLASLLWRIHGRLVGQHSHEGKGAQCPSSSEGEKQTLVCKFLKSGAVGHSAWLTQTPRFR